MLTVALTGDVGAGKSTVARVWRDMGACVIDADAVAKRQWLRPEVMEQAVARWGDSVRRADGSPDYAAIARHAFQNEEEHAFTNALIHPGARTDLTCAAKAGNGWIVAEIPLLFESGMHDWIDCVAYAAAPIERRIERNAVRGWDAQEILRRERLLLPSAEKQARADFVLFNDGDLEAWKAEARRLGALFLRMSSVCVLQTHCRTEEEATRIGDALVERRLAASANAAAVRSRFRWKGAIVAMDEWSLSCLTTASARRRAMACVRELHSYSLPAITATELRHADPATLRWIAENCE